MGWFSRIQLKRLGVGANAGITLGLQAASVLAALFLDGCGFSEATVVIVYVLGVLLTAALTTAPRYCLVASVLSILSFNYFLVSPRFSFRIEGADVPGTMAVMFVVALIASLIVTEMRKSARASAEALALAQNEQLRANLLRSVSHDLRTPLTAISGSADMLLDDSVHLGEQERRRLTLEIRDDAAWLYGVVENLLTITRLEDGKVALDREVELVNDVVEEALRHVNRDVERHHLCFEPSDEMLLARMDVRVVMQALVNLVNNAIAHTPDGSHIVVQVRHQEGFAEIRVADDGPGIPQQDKPHIFDSFYTSEGRAVIDGRRGIGLGLALCRSIVEAHGGKLWIEDSVPQGATFVFTLPLEEVPIDE